MLPYLVVLAIVILMAMVSDSSVLRNSVSSQKLCAAAIAIILILFQGLRSSHVGTDSNNYVGIFNQFASLDDIWWSTEIGYSTLSAVLSMTFDSYNWLFVGIALLVVTFYVGGIGWIAPLYGLPLFLFVALGYYTFGFNGARQAIAASISFFALGYLLQRRSVRYFSMIALAATFHHSAVVTAPLYLLARGKIKWRHFVYIAFFVGISVWGLSRVVELSAVFLTDSYASYAEKTERGGLLTATYLLCQGLALYFLRPKRSADVRVYSYLLSTYAIGIVPVLVSVIASVNPSGIMRLHIYFTHTAILLWPLAVRNIRNPMLRALLVTSVCTLASLYFYFTTSTFSDLAPYQFTSGG